MVEGPTEAEAGILGEADLAFLEVSLPPVRWPDFLGEIVLAFLEIGEPEERGPDSLGKAMLRYS